MKVSELIKELQKHDPEKEIMIQQGEDYDYMTVYSVKSEIVVEMDGEDDEIKAIVIKYK